MSYILDSTTIKRPHDAKEENSTQMAQRRTLAGTVRRDYFGANKRIWTLNYSNVNKTDYDTIKTIYTNYLSDGTARSWQVTETNYTVATTQVHIDLQERDFSVGGSDYISDFTLVLTEV